jgi:hypothetical protein
VIRACVRHRPSLDNPFRPHDHAYSHGLASSGSVTFLPEAIHIGLRGEAEITVTISQYPRDRPVVTVSTERLTVR